MPSSSSSLDPSSLELDASVFDPLSDVIDCECDDVESSAVEELLSSDDDADGRQQGVSGAADERVRVFVKVLLRISICCSVSVPT